MKLKQLNMLFVICISLISNTSYASSSDSWNEHGKEVAEKCIKAANLKNAKAAGDLITYDDAVGFDALLIKGTYPQAHMNKQPGKALCLFDRKSRTAYIAEADNLTK